MYIYRAIKKDWRYIPPKETVKEFETEIETISWLRNNGGGTYRNILHNFDCVVLGKNRLSIAIGKTNA